MNLSLTLFAQLLVFAVPVAVVAAIFFVLRYLRRRAHPDRRLATLDALHAAGKITAVEHERQRASIISGV